MDYGNSDALTAAMGLNQKNLPRLLTLITILHEKTYRKFRFCRFFLAKNWNLFCVFSLHQVFARNSPNNDQKFRN